MTFPGLFTRPGTGMAYCLNGAATAHMATGILSPQETLEIL